jgi:hypothetical protein
MCPAAVLVAERALHVQAPRVHPPRGYLHHLTMSAHAVLSSRHLKTAAHSSWADAAELLAAPRPHGRAETARQLTPTCGWACAPPSCTALPSGSSRHCQSCGMWTRGFSTWHVPLDRSVAALEAAACVVACVHLPPTSCASCSQRLPWTLWPSIRVCSTSHALSRVASSRLYW